MEVRRHRSIRCVVHHRPRRQRWPRSCSSQGQVFDSPEEERTYRKQRLAAGFRLFSKFGFDEGVAGHITARDPERLDHFWVNPFAMHFGQIRVSDLILVNHEGEVVEGDKPVNTAAFAIHSPDPRRPTRRGGCRPRPLHLREVVVGARSPPRPDHPGRLRLLRGSQRVRRLHRRGPRPRGGQADRPRPGRQQGGHPAQPRTADRRPLGRRGGVVVHHHGALVPGPAAGLLGRARRS